MPAVLSDRSPVTTRQFLGSYVRRVAPLLVFVATAFYLWWTFGNRLVIGTNDEGIYLDAAERILHGQKPYVDFFGVVTPGSFWVQVLAFRLLGLTQAAGRIPVIFYLALECALIYWLVERYASQAAAIVTTLFFLAFQTADPAMVTAQHRWDSGALALASIAICVASQKKWLIASGFLVACAALATPSVALVALVTVVWLRTRAAWYLLGLSLGMTVAGLALWLDGILPAFFGQLGWLSRNYAAVNVMHYGAIIGGYRALFEGARAWELPIRACVVLCIALPAVLPVVALVGGTALCARHEGRHLLYLLLCVLALVVSTFPRSDIAHLAYVAALPYAVAGIVLYHWISVRPRAWLTKSPPLCCKQSKNTSDFRRQPDNSRSDPLRFGRWPKPALSRNAHFNCVVEVTRHLPPVIHPGIVLRHGSHCVSTH